MPRRPLPYEWWCYGRQHTWVFPLFHAFYNEKKFREWLCVKWITIKFNGRDTISTLQSNKLNSKRLACECVWAVCIICLFDGLQSYPNSNVPDQSGKNNVSGEVTNYHGRIFRRTRSMRQERRWRYKRNNVKIKNPGIAIVETSFRTSYLGWIDACSHMKFIIPSLPQAAGINSLFVRRIKWFHLSFVVSHSQLACVVPCRPCCDRYNG